MNQKYIYNICTRNIYILFIFSAIRVSEGSYKPLFSSTFKGSNEIIHFNAFLEQVPWDEADVTCKLYFGYLFSGLPENSTFRQKLKEREIDLLWVGIRRKGNFYSYPADISRTLLYKENTDNGKWENTQVIGNFWIHGERFLDDCVVLNVLTGKLMTRDCGLNFPFVCESNGTFTENNKECPKNWNLAIPLSITGMKCISGMNDARPYSEAEIFCGENESRLATRNEYKILKSRNQLPFTVEDKGFWAQKENESCTYQFLGANGTVIAHKPPFCSKPLSFICVKSMEKEDFEVSIQVDPCVNFIDFGPMSSWNISSETNDIMTCGKNEHRNLIYQWFKDDVPIECFTYVCRMSFLGSTVMWKIDGNDHRVKQGSYHCEVRHRGLVKSYASKKIDHFYSGVASYIIDIHGIEREKYVDHSQNGFDRKMQRINPAIETISGESNALWDFKSLRRIGETYSMKLVLFINRTDGYNDAEAFKNLARSFQEKISHFWGELGKNISLIVSSADVCFQDDSNSSNMCSNEIEWNTTKQVKNVLTERACLDEERKFVHRECKGSLVNTAQWSDFNCSVCKNFTERYQDQTVQCPHGYDKFKNQDLCFRIYHEKQNWHDAHKTCAESSSYMLDIPYMNDIGSVESLWLSFKYSQGRIQGFGKKPINLKTLYEKKEMLLENITGESNELYCVSAVRERSEYKFKFENCSLKMSFVCVRRVYELMSSVKFASTWIKQRKLKNVESCYYFENSPYSWTEIGKFCEETFFGAKLLNGILDINSYRYLKKLIIDRQFNETEYSAISWWMNFEHVIQNGVPTNLTYVDWGPLADFSIKEPHGVITLFPNKEIYWSLEEAHRRLRLICEIQDCHDDRPERAYIENRLCENSEDTRDWPYKLPYKFYLKCIPSGWFVTGSISWYKDDILLCKDDILLGIFSDELSFNNSAIVTDEKALEYQGYYSCSVDLVENKQIKYSSKHLFRIPEYFTFVLSMVSKEKKYLNDCPQYILSTTSYENLTLSECFNTYFKNSLSFDSFHFLLKNLTCNRTHVNILIHIYLKEDGFQEEEMLKMILNSILSADFNSFCELCNIDNTSIVARSTAVCYREEVQLKNRVLRWRTTELGKSSFPDQLCLTDEGLVIERRCTGDFNSGAVWSDVSITKCRDTESNVTEELFHLFSAPLSPEESITNSLPRLPNLTSMSEQLQPSDIQLTVGILGNVARNASFPSDKLEKVVKTISNLIDVPKDVLSMAAAYSNQVIGYFETIASNIDEEYEETNISTKNVHTNVYPFKMTVPNCIYLSNSSTTHMINVSADALRKRAESDMQNFEAGIVVPNSLLEEKSNVSDRVVFSIFQNINYQENVTVLSAVISATLHNVSVYDLERKEIALLFKFNKKIVRNVQKQVACVFWDDNIKTWSYKGCFLTYSSQDLVWCACNHLTSFTVIMTGSVPSNHEHPLAFITFIGCSLSCIGFGMIILTFVCFREWRKSLKNKCLFNFSISHFLFLVIYMVGIDKIASGIWCKVTAIVLHYFLLSSFAWMIVLAYTLYLSLVKIFATYIPCMIQKSIAFAWGLPVIIVIITLSVKHKDYFGEEVCWLSPEISTYGMMIPLILMLIVNYIVFGTILYLNTCGTKYIACNQEKRKLVIARAKALLCSSILLGLSWILGCFVVEAEGDLKVFLGYLFILTTTFQGFLLAVFFILRPKLTRQMWMKLLTSPAINFKSHTSNLNSTSSGSQGQSKIENRYENMVYGVVFNARARYSPYT